MCFERSARVAKGAAYGGMLGGADDEAYLLVAILMAPVTAAGTTCGNNGTVDAVHVEGGDKVVRRKDDDGKCKSVDDNLGDSVAHNEEGVVYVEQDGD